MKSPSSRRGSFNASGRLAGRGAPEGEQQRSRLDPYLVRPAADPALLKTGAGNRVELPPEAAEPRAGHHGQGPAPLRQVPPVVRAQAVEARDRVPESEQGIHAAAVADLQGGPRRQVLQARDPDPTRRPGRRPSAAPLQLRCRQRLTPLPCPQLLPVHGLDPPGHPRGPAARTLAGAFSPGRRTGCPGSADRSGAPRPGSAAGTPRRPTRCSGHASGPAASRMPRTASSPRAPGR